MEENLLDHPKHKANFIKLSKMIREYLKLDDISLDTVVNKQGRVGLDKLLEFYSRFTREFGIGTGLYWPHQLVPVRKSELEAGENRVVPDLTVRHLLIVMKEGWWISPAATNIDREALKREDILKQIEELYNNTWWPLETFDHDSVLNSFPAYGDDVDDFLCGLIYYFKVDILDIPRHTYFYKDHFPMPWYIPVGIYRFITQFIPALWVTKPPLTAGHLIDVVKAGKWFDPPDHLTSS